MNIPNKISDRLSMGLKRFQPILIAAKSRDVNESDTSMIDTCQDAQRLNPRQP